MHIFFNGNTSISVKIFPLMSKYKRIFLYWKTGIKFFDIALQKLAFYGIHNWYGMVRQKIEWQGNLIPALGQIVNWPSIHKIINI